MEKETRRLEPPQTQTLVTVTDRAVQELKAALAAQSETFEGVRLGVSGGGCCGPGYMLALATSKEPNDVVVEVDGVKVLVNDTEQEALRGAVLDFVETPAGSGFHVENPNVVREEHGHGHGGCACGGHGGCGCGGHGQGGCGC